MTTLEEKLNALEALNLSAAQDSMGSAAGEMWLVAPLHIMCGTLATIFNYLFVFVYFIFVCLFVCLLFVCLFVVPL